MINLRGHMPRFTSNWTFPIYVLRNARNVCWKPQKRDSLFSDLIDLRRHMSRFAWKMNIFPFIFLEMPEMCVENLRRGIVFLRPLIWGVTCLGLLWEMKIFPIYLPRNPINVCWNPQKRDHFSKMIDLKGHMPWFDSERWIFSHISSWKPHKSVLKPSGTELTFWRWSICRGHMPRFDYERWTFSHLPSWKLHKYVLKPSGTVLIFLKMIVLQWSHA